MNLCKAVTIVIFYLSLSVQAEPVVFDNFSEPVVLTAQENGLHLKTGSSLTVQLAPRLIVKTRKNFSAQQLTQLVPQATKITDLFLATHHRYFLLHFARQDEALTALKTLQQRTEILLVQPDLRQKRTRAENLPRFNQVDKAPLNDNSILPFYLQSVKNTHLWPGKGGAGVVVAVIDSGFHLEHKEFADVQIDLHYSFLEKKIITRDQIISQQTHDHGTLVAGILFGAHNQQAPEGLIPKASLVAIDQPDTWTSETLQSFYLAALAHADVINCSWHSRWLLQPIQEVVDDLAQFGRNGKGVAIIVAAGNEGQPLAPHQHEASIASAVVVGTKNKQGKPAANSNYGDLVDVWLLEEKILSTSKKANYNYFAGTSLSAAIVTGYVALIMASHPEIKLAEVQKKLMQIQEGLR